MLLLKEKKYIGNSTLIVILFILVRLCVGQITSESYSDLLKEAVQTCGMSRSEFKLVFPNPGRIPPGPFFVPIKGLDNSDAVPFLIDVLKRGPEWSDEILLTQRGGMYPHIARCYAALCLGAISDSRALEPLTEMLKNGDFLEQKYPITYPRKERYNIRDYAALALGYLRDPNAVDYLVEFAKNKKTNKSLRWESIKSLSRIRDMRTVPIIIEIAEEIGEADTMHDYLAYMTKVEFNLKYSREDRAYTVREFPELGKIDSSLKVWRHWLNIGKKYTEDEFQKQYSQWHTVKQTHSEEKAAIKNEYRKMLKFGVASLPLMIEKISQGELALIPAVSELTNRNLKEDATQDECLQWWKKNKQRWLIPFKKN